MNHRAHLMERMLERSLNSGGRTYNELYSVSKEVSGSKGHGSPAVSVCGKWSDSCVVGRGQGVDLHLLQGGVGHYPKRRAIE